MFRDIIKIVYLIKGGADNRSQILALIADILQKAIIRISVLMFFILFFLFILGFTDIFGKDYLFIKIQFVFFLIATIASLAILYIIYKVIKNLTTLK